MKKIYDPKFIEEKWSSAWQSAELFKVLIEEAVTAYTIFLPPPNVTGTLHMGHGFQQTLMDILVRYHRMCGKNVLWQVGCDHAGIATQMVVERQLAQQGLTRDALGREKFIDEVWAWKENSGTNIASQMARLGVSVDWSRSRFTMDPAYSHAVMTAFVSLYEAGLIYKGKRLVNWDPSFLTAISDLEVTYTEEEGKLWYIRYPLADCSNQSIVIATTRPETLLGDVAVAVHPDDLRYQSLIGKQLRLPLTERLIPIIADEAVEADFGTGCVKITPAHDFNDYAMGERHQLSCINIFTPTAKLNENTPEKYQGLDRFVARKKIIADLTALGLLEKTEKHQLKVPRGDRSGDVIEPYLTDQWFVRATQLAEAAKEAVTVGETTFVPKNWENTYFQWLNNIEDWCISRQLWWGHRIPVWYDESGNVYVAETEALLREKYQLSETVPLRQEADVLDTWFSSALWPFATLGWPDKTPEFLHFYPSQVLVTGFDIIFFWVARMMMFALYFLKKVPFSSVYITGLIRDAEGQKMSKSKGNVLDPIDLMDGIDLPALIQKRTQGLMQPEKAKSIEKATRQHFPDGIPAAGADALRFTFAALASHGREIRFDMQRLIGYRNFCNKLWNAARYVQLQLDQHPIMPTKHEVLGLAERWILSLCQQTITAVHKYIQAYRFDLAAQMLYEFTWNAYCDWYLEFSKIVLNNDDADPAEKNATAATVLQILECILQMLHPFMPFITEEIWSFFHENEQQNEKDQKKAFLALQQYPLPTLPSDAAAVEEVSWIQTLVNGIRQLRGEKKISPAQQIIIYYATEDETEKARLLQHAHYLQVLAKVEQFMPLPTEKNLGLCASIWLGELELHLPLDAYMDKAEERARLSRLLEKVTQEIDKCEKKLENPQFVDKAPEKVVQQERLRLSDYLANQVHLKTQLEQLQ